MTVKINSPQCDGCGAAAETACTRICPGNLLVKRAGKAAIRERSLCWDCASCVKACPKQAISLILPPALGGSNVELKAERYRGGIRWRCVRNGETIEEFHCDRVLK